MTSYLILRGVVNVFSIVHPIFSLVARHLEGIPIMRAHSVMVWISPLNS